MNKRNWTYYNPDNYERKKIRLKQGELKCIKCDFYNDEKFYCNLLMGDFKIFLSCYKNFVFNLKKEIKLSVKKSKVKSKVKPKVKPKVKSKVKLKFF